MIFAEMERWLDQAGHRDFLRQPEIAKMVVDAIRHRHAGGIWQMFEYVVMPTHVHLFFEPVRPGLKETLEDFKRWTGHQAANLLGTHGDRLWQREWFDHWSRSDEEDERIARYIRENPMKAGLVGAPELWPYASNCRPLGGI
jgi:REP element-mobilizing transposase RayT